MVVAESLTSSYWQNECGRKLWMREAAVLIVSRNRSRTIGSGQEALASGQKGLTVKWHQHC